MLQILGACSWSSILLKLSVGDLAFIQVSSNHMGTIFSNLEYSPDLSGMLQLPPSSYIFNVLNQMSHNHDKLKTYKRGLISLYPKPTLLPMNPVAPNQW